MPLLLDWSAWAFVLWPSLIATVAVVWFYFQQSRLRRLVNKIPGPKGLPILGSVLDFYTDHTAYVGVVENYCKQFKEGILKIWFLHAAYVFVYEAKMVEPILSSMQHLDKSYDYTFLQPWLGTGLLTSTGNKWRSRRKLLTPTFHFRILEDFIHVFNEQSETLVRQLGKEVGKDSFDISPYITMCTLDIICESAMGRNINAQEHTDSDYVKAIYQISNIIHSRQFSPWLWPDWIFSLTSHSRVHKKCLKILHDFTNKVIQEKKKELLKNGPLKSDDSEEVFGKKRRLAFLDLLITASEGGRVLSDEDIREEVDTFMFEGHDTTAAGITWALYLLGRHLDVQNKVQNELDTIFGDSDRPCTSDDFRNMKYLDCVIKEALRIFPSVPLVARTLREDIQIDKYLVPAGATVIVSPFFLHRNLSVFPNPDAFTPERFLPENAQGRHPYAYVPFSAGPRNCIGQKFALMEEKVVISAVLRKYQVESLNAKEEIPLLAELILRPQGGINMKITPRKTKHLIK